MLKCTICGKPAEKFVWRNVPINGVCYEHVCDHCAVQYLGVFLEENAPEYSREAVSHYAEYAEAVKLISSIKEET